MTNQYPIQIKNATWAIEIGGFSEIGIVVPHDQIGGLTDEEIGRHVREAMQTGQHLYAIFQAQWICSKFGDVAVAEHYQPWKIDPDIMSLKPVIQQAFDYCEGDKNLEGEMWSLRFALDIIDSREEYDRCKAAKPAKRAELTKNYDRFFNEIAQRDGIKCKRCGKKRKLAIDHIFPLSLGGSNNLENLQLLCGSCNSSKGARV
jgi:hypothetical protein